MCDEYSKAGDPAVGSTRLVMPYMKYLLWRTLFRATPAKWIVRGCNGWATRRGRFGQWVTEKFAEA